jgi:hypothetical protein
MADDPFKLIDQYVQLSTLISGLRIVVQQTGKSFLNHIDLDVVLDGLLRYEDDVVNNITTTIPGKILDARQGKYLYDLSMALGSGIQWQDQVLTIANTPPVSPTDGDRHLVGTSPTGAWVDHENEIATWDSTGSAWTFEDPVTRWGIFIHDALQMYVYYGEWLLLGDLDRINEMMETTEAARDTVLTDPGFIIVAADLLGSDTIGQVASNAVNINAVAGNKSNIDAVALNQTNINAVNANKANIDNVAGNKSNIDAVALNQTNINAVNANKANIDNVAGNKSNIDIVAGNNANIITVAGIEAHVITVAGISVAITTVAGRETEILALAARTTEIDALYAQLSTIASKANQTDLDATNSRLTGLDTLVYEGTTYRVSKRIENGHLVTTYTEVI